MTNESLEASWDYEFQHWKNVTGFEPIELIASADHSASYEMDRMHVFKLKSGQYATVEESGCSCYSVSEAIINFYPTEKEAMAVFKNYEFHK